jgi:hypothetical protein
MFLSIAVTAWRQGKGVFALRGALELHTEYPAFRRVLVQDCPHYLGVLEVDTSSNMVTWTPESHATSTTRGEVHSAVTVPLPPGVGRMRRADQLYALMHVEALRHAVMREVSGLPEVQGSGFTVPARDPDTAFGGGTGNEVITIGWRLPVESAEVRFLFPDEPPRDSGSEHIGAALALVIGGEPVIFRVWTTSATAVEKMPGVIGLPRDVEAVRASTEFPVVSGASEGYCEPLFSCVYAARQGTPWDEVRRGLAGALAHGVVCGLEGAEVSVAVTRADGEVITRVSPDNAHLWEEK